MTVHRFKVGDLVRTRPSVSTHFGEAFIDSVSPGRPSSIYEVKRVLPELVNGEPQYRVGCEGQPERVVREGQLVSATTVPEAHR
jgi:uncharacterized cupin superfamily protein